MYSFVTIAKCEVVLQWGFDETSFDGIPTLNQWCRIQEGEAYWTITIECAGLLIGSTSTPVVQHVKVLWERGQEIVRLLREELGDSTDALTPLVNGGVTITKLRGVSKLHTEVVPAQHNTRHKANVRQTDERWKK